MAPGFITVEEFEAMDLPEFCEWELIDGTVVSVSTPDLDHIDLQDQIGALLKDLFTRSAVVRVEYPYALGGFSRFRADVAIVDPSRHRANRKRLEGAPELVVEVMSRSNTNKKTQLLQERCFAQGCQAFWRVYPKKKEIVVGRWTESGVNETEYGLGAHVPIELFGTSGQVSVENIFVSLR